MLRLRYQKNTYERHEAEKRRLCRIGNIYRVYRTYNFGKDNALKERQ